MKVGYKGVYIYTDMLFSHFLYMSLKVACKGELITWTCYSNNKNDPAKGSVMYII